MASSEQNSPTVLGKPVIGLIGAPGSGKSLVARHFQTLGCAVIDADELAHEALDEPEVQRQIVQWWGEGMVDKHGWVRRRKLGRVVFEQSEELRRLEGLVHPRVALKRARLREEYGSDPAVKAIVEDCPLLLEKHLDADVDVLVFVDAPLSVRQARLHDQRGWSPQEVERREKNQMPLDSKRARADYVVDNGASESACFDEVARVLSQIFHQRA